MVHQRNETNVRIVFEVLEMIEHIVGGDLAAQVDEVIGAQPVLALCRLDGIGHVAHFAVLEAAVLVGAHTQAIEDGGDAGRDDLRVMRLDRRRLVPANARARRIMRFQMIGMQLDQAGDQIVALEILADVGTAFGNVGNPAVADQYRTVKNLVLENDAGVGEDGFFGHVRSFSFGRRQAAARNGR